MEKNLTEIQIKKIMETVRNFGINFYSDSDVYPDIDALNNIRLSGISK